MLDGRRPPPAGARAAVRSSSSVADRAPRRPRRRRRGRSATAPSDDPRARAAAVAVELDDRRRPRPSAKSPARRASSTKAHPCARAGTGSSTPVITSAGSSDVVKCVDEQLGCRDRPLAGRARARAPSRRARPRRTAARAVASRVRQAAADRAAVADADVADAGAPPRPASGRRRPPIADRSRSTWRASADSDEAVAVALDRALRRAGDVDQHRRRAPGRSIIIGTRLWPPAITRASSPRVLRAARRPRPNDAGPDVGRTARRTSGAGYAACEAREAVEHRLERRPGCWSPPGRRARARSASRASKARKFVHDANSRSIAAAAEALGGERGDPRRLDLGDREVLRDARARGSPTTSTPVGLEALADLLVQRLDVRRDDADPPRAARARSPRRTDAATLTVAAPVSAARSARSARPRRRCRAARRRWCSRTRPRRGRAVPTSRDRGRQVLVEHRRLAPRASSPRGASAPCAAWHRPAAAGRGRAPSRCSTTGRSARRARSRHRHRLRAAPTAATGRCRPRSPRRRAAAAARAGRAGCRWIISLDVVLGDAATRARDCANTRSASAGIGLWRWPASLIRIECSGPTARIASTTRVERRVAPHRRDRAVAELRVRALADELASASSRSRLGTLKNGCVIMIFSHAALTRERRRAARSRAPRGGRCRGSRGARRSGRARRADRRSARRRSSNDLDAGVALFATVLACLS